MHQLKPKVRAGANQSPFKAGFGANADLFSVMTFIAASTKTESSVTSSVVTFMLHRLKPKVRVGANTDLLCRDVYAASIETESSSWRQHRPLS